MLRLTFYYEGRKNDVNYSLLLTFVDFGDANYSGSQFLCKSGKTKR